MLHRTERLDVLLAAVLPVEAACHEVSAVVLFEQAAFEHLDSGGLCHEVVGVFDAAVEAASAEFVVLADAVEFEQPVVKTGVGRQLPGADFVRLRIPGDDGLDRKSVV